MKNSYKMNLIGWLLVAACMMSMARGYAQNTFTTTAFRSISSENGTTGVRPAMNDNGRAINNRGWYYYDDGANVDAIGLTNGGSFYWGIMFPAGSYTGNVVTKVSMYDNTTHTGNIMIYQGGTTAPGTLVYTQAYACTGSANFVEWTLSAPVAVNPNQSLWIVMHNNDGQYVAPACNDTGDPNGRWISTNGTAWNDLMAVNPDFAYTWMLRAYIETINSYNWDFENGMNGWTTIDADGDGYNWYAITGNSNIHGHNNSNGLATSASWYDTIVGALTPNNYLVSPLVNLGGTFSFWACAQDANYPSEHFGVAVSTSGNSNPNNFTTIQSWTLTAKGVGEPTDETRSGNRSQGNWYQYTVNLGSYAGQTGYIAIRHFGCTDMFRLNVDDATLTTNTQYYTITVSTNPANGGSPYVGNTPGVTQGSYTSGQSCTVHANPASGYNFSKWTENGNQVSTNANYTFTVTGNRNLVAHYTLQQYTINTAASPTYGGVVTGGGTFNYGQTCSLHATPYGGYTFLKWTKNGTDYPGSSPDISFTVTGNATFVAYFQQSVNNYTVNVLANPTTGGIVTGNGTYQQGQQCTVTATANEGYEFVNWTENGLVVSEDNSFNFTVNSNCILVANFVLKTYDITVTVDPAEGGSVLGQGTYHYGDECTLIAVPNSGFSFAGWENSGNFVTTDPVWNFIVIGSDSYVAHFVQSTNNFTITASADPTEGGSVTGSGNYSQGEECTLTATPNDGYTFVNWTKNGSPVSTEPSFSFTVTENASYVAHFMQNANGYTISVSANPTEGGIVTGAGTYAPGLTITLTAMANEGYKFTNWTENGVIQWMTDQYEFIVDRERILVANFEALPKFTITAMAGANGTITPQGDVQVVQGADQTFTMTPNFGCRIIKVQVDGIDIGPVESYTFTNVNRDHTIFVSFSGMGVEEAQVLNVNVYPNPAKDKVFVEGEGIETVVLYDMLGNCLRSMDYNMGKELNVSGLSQGTYILRLTIQGGRVGYKKLMITD